MPGFDGTGPLGKGPFTGRGEGYCVLPDDWSKVAREVNSSREIIPARPVVRYPSSRVFIPIYTLGRGFGRGHCRRGHGRGRWF